MLPDQNATADTQFFTGSTTKAFTAAAVAQIVHEGEHPNLRWNTPINEFLRSDFVLENDYATSHTTIEDALSHRSGLPRHDLMYGQAHDTPSSIVQRMRYLPITAEPRTAFQYCNLMFVVMTDLIETLTGKYLESVLREYFWKPLGMSSTTFTLPKEQDRSRLARGYYWHSSDGSGSVDSEHGEYVPDPYLDILPISGAGATISTVNDYALWMKAWLDASSDAVPQNTSSPVTDRIVRDLATARTIILPDADQGQPAELHTPPLYGLGWITADIFGEKIIVHNGGLTGFGTQLYLFPNIQYGIVTMGNTAGTSNFAGDQIAAKLLMDKIRTAENVHVNSADIVHEQLQALTRATLRPAKLGHRHGRLSSLLMETKAASRSLSLDELAGTYSNPGYGNITFVVATADAQSSEQRDALLEGGLYDRTWPVKIQLHRLANTHFSSKLLEPHGLGDIRSGENIVWEDVGESDAVFGFGLDGETVETFGIGLDDEMIERTAEKGEEYWREALIWFRKA